MENEKDLLSPASIELMQTILANQTRELDLSGQNLELQKQQDTHSYEIAKKSLDVQAKDLADERRHKLELWKMISRLALVAVLALTLVTVTALFLGKEQFVLELTKIALYGGSGAAVGFFYQKSKRKNESEDL